MEGHSPTQSDIFASDSKMHMRKWKDSISGEDKSFIGCLGTVLHINNKSEFAIQYDQIMNQLKEDFDPHFSQETKRVLKAYNIKKILSGRTDVIDAFLTKFSKAILNNKNVKTNFFFTTIVTTKLKDRKISIYADLPNRDQINVLSFLNILSNYYNYICVWKLIEETKLFNQNIILDHFEGKETKAWRKLVGNNKVHTVPNGDGIFPSLSAADILTSWIDRSLSRFKFKLDYTGIRAFLNNCKNQGFTYANEPFICYIGNVDLEYIVPVNKNMINIGSYLLHPVIFIIKEEIFTKEKEIILNSPKMNKIYDKAIELQVGIKFFDPRRDSHLITSGDYFVVLGKKGEKSFSLLMDLVLCYPEYVG